jgi:hypothetical protein
MKKCMIMEACKLLTCFLHGVFEVGEVVALGHLEVPVGVLGMQFAGFAVPTASTHALGTMKKCMIMEAC